MPARLHVAVVGAGAFGGWTALWLLRRGARVTLLDAWGPGNSRASSGGETRVIRGTYGADQPYSRMTARALELWRENQQRWGKKLLHANGVLWLGSDVDDQFERDSLPALRDAGIPNEELSAGEVRKRWPQINVEGVPWAIYEPTGGFLAARAACQTVVEHFVAEGGEYREMAVAAHNLDEPWRSLSLGDGSKLAADQYVIAAGPWLPQLFPASIGSRLRVTRQEVFFFGTAAGDHRFHEQGMPVWADHRERFLYGIPANRGHGFKIADDTRGPEFDPTSGDRTAGAAGLKVVRDYLAFRFPAMKDAPLLEARVCQYEGTPDNHFILDRHPEMSNVWIAGGGSGHGFKHGPAVGEMMAACVLDGRLPDAYFRLGRFK